MKKAFRLGAALLATTLAFTACGDDSSTSADDEKQSGENQSEESASTTVTETTTGSLEIDEKAQTLQM